MEIVKNAKDWIFYPMNIVQGNWTLEFVLWLDFRTILGFRTFVGWLPSACAISRNICFQSVRCLTRCFQPARLNGSELIAFRELALSDLIELEVESPVWSARHLLTELVTRPELPQVSCHRDDYSLSKLTLCCPFLPSCYLWEGKKAAGDGADYYEFLFALLCSQTTNVLRSSCLFSSCMINDNNK